MPRYELVQETSRKFWEIAVDGSSLTTRWGRIGTRGQSATKAFASAPEARREYDKLVAAKLRKGYSLASGSAGERPPTPPAKGGRAGRSSTSMGEPVRRDVAVYNEATGFVITSRRMAGAEIDSKDRAWSKAVVRGDLLPIELVQDDSFVIRVVVGSPLEASESDEWVGHLSWKLRVQDGRLVVAGGQEFVMEPLERDETGESEYVRILEMPRGEYRADLYAYLHGVNGDYLLGRTVPESKKAEPAGAYFRRTRPGDRFPHWLRAWCTSYPGIDPAHQDEWEGPGPGDGPEYVDFLLHLTPLEKGEAAPPKLSRGWFSFDAFAVRKPERCPLGIEATNVLRFERPAPVAPPPVKTVDVAARVAAHVPSEVRGGPVSIPLPCLARAYRLAWFATDSVDPEIHISVPPGAAFELSLADVEWAVAERAEDDWRVGLPSTDGKWVAVRTIEEVGPRLFAVPDGSVVELLTAPEEPEGEPPIGTLRFRGAVSGGLWHIAEAFPPVDAVRLREALELSSQCEEGRELALASAEEAALVQTGFLKGWGFLVQDNPLRREGATLGIEKPSRSILHLLAAEAFRLRYGGTWTMPGAEEPFDLGGLVATAAGVRGWQEGERLLEGSAHRTYRRYDLRSLGERAAARVEETDRTLADLGYAALGDLVCSASADVVKRAYARPEGDTYGALLHGRFGQESFDFVTRFARAAGLTTTLTPDTKDDTRNRNFKTSHPKADLPALHAHHEKRKAELAGKYGSPLAVQQDLLSFARALEAAMVRETGE